MRGRKKKRGPVAFARLKFFPSRWRGRFIGGGGVTATCSASHELFMHAYTLFRITFNAWNATMSNRNGERGKFESISKSHIFDCHKETLQLKTRRHFINLSRAETFPSNGSSINFSINNDLTVETVRVKMDCTRLDFLVISFLWIFIFGRMNLIWI